MKRKALDLKRGDFFNIGTREVVVLKDARMTANPALCEVLTMQTSNGNTAYTSFGPEEELEVASYLSPAQIHAEELVVQLNELVAFVLAGQGHVDGWDAIVASAKRGRVLVDAIMPPEPVPEAELLAALVDLPNAFEYMPEEDAKRVAAILDRAYRSGQLKRRGDSHANDKA